MKKRCMKRVSFHKQIAPPLLLLTLLALIAGCATVREQTIVPACPGTLTQRYNGAGCWNINTGYSYGRPLYPFDPNYCDPFLGEPFCSWYKSFHDPYWYYYNAYFYPYQPYYPFYPYFPYYGYYYYDYADHHHRRGLRHIIKDRADERKDARDNRVKEWHEERKDAWNEIEAAIRERRDTRMEQWQGIRDRAQDRREERIEQWQDFRGRMQDRVREMGEERRERWDNFSNNAVNAFSRIGEQRQERIEQRRDFFKEHGLFRNDNHQPLFNRDDNNNGNGSGLFNGGVLRGLGGGRR
jgi:hypothetical protein